MGTIAGKADRIERVERMVSPPIGSYCRSELWHNLESRAWGEHQNRHIRQDCSRVENIEVIGTM